MLQFFRYQLLRAASNPNPKITGATLKITTENTNDSSLSPETIAPIEIQKFTKNSPHNLIS
jgi:hypothetical protein